MVIAHSDCIACSRLRLNRSGRFSCEAFPQGIPEALIEGRVNHREPYPGDHGIRFLPDPDAPAEVLRELAIVA